MNPEQGLGRQLRQQRAAAGGPAAETGQAAPEWLVRWITSARELDDDGGLIGQLRKLTEQEINLWIDQARAIGEL